MFFLALFGLVDAKFLLRNFKYGIIVIFIIAGVICPLPDPLGMCLFACPLLVLYLLGIGTAFIAHPSRRKAKTQPHNAELGLVVLSLLRFAALLKAQREAQAYVTSLEPAALPTGGHFPYALRQNQEVPPVLCLSEKTWTRGQVGSAAPTLHRCGLSQR